MQVSLRKFIRNNLYKSLDEKLHTKKDALKVLNLIHNNITNKAELIGFNEELKNKIFYLLNAESVENTDWGGWYFNNTDFGDVDIFYTTEDFDY